MTFFISLQDPLHIAITPLCKGQSTFSLLALTFFRFLNIKELAWEPVAPLNFFSLAYPCRRDCPLWCNIKFWSLQRLQFKGLAHLQPVLNKVILVFFFTPGEHYWVQMRTFLYMCNSEILLLKYFQVTSLGRLRWFW